MFRKLHRWKFSTIWSLLEFRSRAVKDYVNCIFITSKMFIICCYIDFRSSPKLYFACQIFSRVSNSRKWIIPSTELILFIFYFLIWNYEWNWCLVLHCHERLAHSWAEENLVIIKLFFSFYLIRIGWNLEYIFQFLAMSETGINLVAVIFVDHVIATTLQGVIQS